MKLKLACRATTQVFIQKAAVNLLSTVLDTPEFLCVPAGLLLQTKEHAAPLNKHLVSDFASLCPCVTRLAQECAVM